MNDELKEAIELLQKEAVERLQKHADYAKASGYSRGLYLPEQILLAKAIPVVLDELERLRKLRKKQAVVGERPIPGLVYCRAHGRAVGNCSECATEAKLVKAEAELERLREDFVNTEGENFDLLERAEKAEARADYNHGQIAAVRENCEAESDALKKEIEELRGT